jgi:hypothetical protein
MGLEAGWGTPKGVGGTPGVGTPGAMHRSELAGGGTPQDRGHRGELAGKGTPRDRGTVRWQVRMV